MAAEDALGGEARRDLHDSPEALEHEAGSDHKDARDRKAEGPKQRLTFGIYFYSEPVAPKPANKDE